jgi:hypothetical protein
MEKPGCCGAGGEAPSNLIFGSRRYFYCLHEKIKYLWHFQLEKDFNL